MFEVYIYIYIFFLFQKVYLTQLYGLHINLKDIYFKKKSILSGWYQSDTSVGIDTIDIWINLLMFTPCL